ncbi:MFS transporter [uncultured Erythrobacter sp.]|uniref:MFS transporter n=1 Tax=uncultured Erythrobacter sp. TaxID=263913 RepID=UPI002622F213|nr:MFS transporter [uncultured Erythrobacter sp.]
MTHGTQTGSHRTPPMSGTSLLWPLVLTTSLFFIWGLSYGLLEVLNKHFQDVFDITKARSTLLQTAYFGAYATVVWPAGRLLEKIGYKYTILVGLAIYAAGAFMFIPSATTASFNFFVASIFILATGLVCVETAASPYVTLLGPSKNADRRIAIAQSVFGLGTFAGPLIGGMMFFADQEPTGGDLSSVVATYGAIGAAVIVFAVIYGLAPLPKAAVLTEDEAPQFGAPTTGLMGYRHFKWAVFAQWLNIGAQVGIGTLFINFVTENWSGIETSKAAYLLSVAMGLFLAGRIVSTAMLGKVSTNVVLTCFAVWNVLLLAIAVADIPTVSTIALMGTLFGCGGTYPLIFALGLRGLGENRKRGAAALVFGVSGGAVVPLVMGVVADAGSTSDAYFVALACYLFVSLFGWKLYKPTAED